MQSRTWWGALALLFVNIGCGDEDASRFCVDGLDSSCAPLYSPTFDNVFDRTLKPGCAPSGSACHATEGGQGGLVFSEREATYQLLTDPTRNLVRPNDGRCSLIIIRMEAEDPKDAMPPNAPLSEAERCAVRQWIDMGAPR